MTRLNLRKTQHTVSGFSSPGSAPTPQEPEHGSQIEESSATVARPYANVAGIRFFRLLITIDFGFQKIVTINEN
jgi:hypothetical protein